jgi:hypothetical protein
MSWTVVLTHGNNPEDKTVVEDFDAALEWIRQQEARIHGGDGQAGLDQMLGTFTWGSEAEGSVQYGTNYHYVNLDKGM